MMEVLLSKKAREILADPDARRQLSESLSMPPADRALNPPTVTVGGRKYRVVFADETTREAMRRSIREELTWAVHNLIAHPLSELLYWVGLGRVGNRLHDATVPKHKKWTGRG